MRNNINGDFSIVEDISELKPGAFININWNKKSEIEDMIFHARQAARNRALANSKRKSSSKKKKS